jgi:hypothetical protein
MPLGEVLTYLRQDGSVVVDEKGYLSATGVMLDAPGGRKGAARRLATEKVGHALVVSQDGGLYLYADMIKLPFRTPPPGGNRNDYPEARLDFLPISEKVHRSRS